MLVDLDKRLGEIQIKVRFTLREQGILALFGPSGSGKTSIINMIAGLMTPDRGEITISDATVFDSEKKINLPPYKRRMGYVFQDSRLFPHLSVTGNLKYGCKSASTNNHCVSFPEVIKTLGIGHILDRRPHHLSGGEKQRVAIGRALLTSPRLLLMDEPLSSIDNSRKQKILEMITVLPQQFDIPILYVSHAPEEIETLGATVLKIRNGLIEE